MKNFAVLAAVLGLAGATPALAGPTITSVQIKNIDGISGQGWLQIAELQLFGGATNYALAGTASATSVYQPGGAVALPKFANDGSTAGNYSYDPTSMSNIYHGNASDGSDVFTLTLAAPTAIDKITIFGRTDCCGARDIYSFTTFNGATVVQSGTLNASATSFASAALPEPATWAMMLLGFGMVGFGLRHRRATKVTTRVAFV